MKKCSCYKSRELVTTSERAQRAVRAHHVVDGGGDLGEDDLGVVLVVAAVLGQLGEQLAPGCHLHDQVDGGHSL